MHGRAEGFRSSSEFSGISNVSSAFHDVDLTAGWPLSVLVVSGKRPNGGPEPISFRKLGLDLDSTVLESEGVDGGQFSTHNGVDVVVSVTGPAASVEEGTSALICRRSTPKFIGVSSSHELSSNLVLSEDGLDVQLSILSEGGSPVVVIDLELPVTSSGESDVVPPLIKVQEIKVILEDKLRACQEEQSEQEQDCLHISLSSVRTIQYKISIIHPIKATVGSQNMTGNFQRQGSLDFGWRCWELFAPKRVGKWNRKTTEKQMRWKITLNHSNPCFLLPSPLQIPKNLMPPLPQHPHQFPHPSSICYDSCKIKYMSEFQTIYSQTQHIINYNTVITEKHNLIPYRTARMQADPNNAESLPLKKFHQYFGKIQPSLYQELKHIFENSSFDQRALTPQPDYHVQGMTLTTRGKFAKRSKDNKELSPISKNHFTIDSIGGRESYKKAKLNKIIMYDSLLDKDASEEENAVSIKEVGELVTEFQQSNRKRRHKGMSRSFRVSKSNPEKQSFLQAINPTNKQRFTTIDLNQIVCILHQIDVQISPNLAYFNVYVEEGNNSELLKSLIRKRNGWRVVELPAVANMIWTQFYRRSLLKKRLHKREKSETEEDKVLKVDTFRRNKVFSSDKRYEINRFDAPMIKSQETFGNQVRKLIPPNELTELAQFRSSYLKTLKPIQISHNVLVHNHFPYNSCISDKKNLLAHLTRYLTQKGRDVFSLLPQSYQLNDLSHPFLDNLQQQNDNLKDYWIIKPGQNSNRGRGITISRSKVQTIEELKKRLNEEPGQRQNIAQRKKRRSVILQKYLKPLLYFGRKFDIRSYMLVTHLNNQLRVYCYEQCYIRTSSKMFDIDSTNKLVHLTNDAIQSHSSEYGKFQEGNKIAESVFAKFIDDQYRKKLTEGTIWSSLKKQMQSICIDVIQSSHETLLKGTKRPLDQSIDVQYEQNYYFQLFGMDFMIDEHFKLWLIEVNTNPAITHDCSRVLNHFIPRMLDNAFAIAVQPIMRPLRLHDLSYTNQFTAVLKKIVP